MNEQLYLTNSFDLKQEQGLKLNPQQVQSLSVLCMNNTELADYIDTLYKENPCIEKTEPEITPEMMQVLSQYKNAEKEPYGRRTSQGDDSPGQQEPARRYVDDYIESISYTAKSQLEVLKIDQALKAVCIYLADMLEDNGRLPRTYLDLVKELGVPADLVDQAVKVIQSLEPAGIGAADTAEYIRLQLERYYPGDSVAIRLTEPELLEQVSKGQYRAAAEKLHVDVQKVKDAAERIRSLDPDISAAYANEEEAVYIRPDVYVYTDGHGRPAVAVNEYDVPKVSVNEKYLELYKTTEDREVKEYLRDKLKETYSLISSVGRRRSTLETCFDCLIKRQYAFFSGKNDILEPVTMRDVAGEIGVNASTVTRALKNKYVQCRNGLFPAKYFFSKKLSISEEPGAERSSHGAKTEMVKIIETEDRKHPLSDAGLCRRLKEMGYEVERRTVTKYRNELSLPDYRMRKLQYQKRDR